MGCSSAKQKAPQPPADDKTYHIGKAFCMRELHISPSRDKYRTKLLKWTKMLQAYSHFDLPISRFRADKPALFQKRLIKGPPIEYRWSAWMAACNLQGSLNVFAQLQYAELSHQVEDDINKDLPRTFSDHPYFSGNKGKAALQRVLKAFALQHRDIGYCQGLNYIAAFTLLVSGGRDEECFFLLCHIVKSFDLQGFYTSRFPGLWKLISQFNSLLEHQNPRLFAHLHQENAYEMTWLGPWFLSLYTTTLPFHFVIRLWDMLLAQGAEALLKLALRLVELMGGQLGKADMEGMAGIFGKMRVGIYDVEAIMKDVANMKLDKGLMAAGLRKYEAGLTDSARNSLIPSISLPQGNEKCAPLPTPD